MLHSRFVISSTLPPVFVLLLSSVLVGQNTYDDLGYGRFVLYRCDNWGFSCSEIYETESRYDTSLPAELVYDAEVQQITVKIDGQIVYTHQLE